MTTAQQIKAEYNNTEPTTAHKEEILASSIDDVLSSLKSEVIKHYFRPLKNDFDNSLRGMARDEPNPALFFSKKIEETRLAREALRNLLMNKITDRVDVILGSIMLEMDSWDTIIGTQEVREVQESNMELGEIGRTSEPPPFPEIIEIADDSQTRPATTSPTPVVGSESSHLDVDGTFQGDTEATASTCTDKRKSASANETPLPQFDADSLSEETRSDCGPASAPSTGTKRPHNSIKNSFGVSKPGPSVPAKRAKTSNRDQNTDKDYLSIKRKINSKELMKNECVHHFGQHKGLYVLRCKLTACKTKLQTPAQQMLLCTSDNRTNGCNELKNSIIYFTADPLVNDRALSHFRGRGHGISRIREIYSKYAIRVTDATEDCNLGNSNDKSSCIALGTAPLRAQCSGPEDGQKRQSPASSKLPVSTDHSVKCRMSYSGANDTSDVNASEQASPQDAGAKPLKRATARAVGTYVTFTIPGVNDDHRDRLKTKANTKSYDGSRDTDYVESVTVPKKDKQPAQSSDVEVTPIKGKSVFEPSNGMDEEEESLFVSEASDSDSDDEDIPHILDVWKKSSRVIV